MNTATPTKHGAAPKLVHRQAYGGGRRPNTSILLTSPAAPQQIVKTLHRSGTAAPAGSWRLRTSQFLMGLQPQWRSAAPPWQATSTPSWASAAGSCSSAAGGGWHRWRAGPVSAGGGSWLAVVPGYRWWLRRRATAFGQAA